MEPSFVTVLIDKEIRFKKSDIEPSKDVVNWYYESEDNRVCSITNVKYNISIYPNGDRNQHRGETWLFLSVILGSALKIETDIACFVESAGVRMFDKDTYTNFAGWGKSICKSSVLFDETKGFFVIDEMIVKVEGSMKIYLPSNRIVYPIFATWKIKQTELEAFKTSVTADEKSFWSKEYTISSDPNIKYGLEICPNGNKEEERGNVWLFLQIIMGNTVKNVKAVYNFLIGSANCSEDFEYEFKESEGWGVNICSTEELFNPENQYFVDGEMIVKLTGTLSVEKDDSTSAAAELPKCEEHTVMNDLSINGEKDFTVAVDEKTIRVHKQVLMNGSPYFVGMFNSGMKEATEMKTTIIDFEQDIVEAGIKILYDSQIPTHFTFEQMLDLLQFSDKYDFQPVKDLLQAHLINALSPYNVCPLINFTTTTVSAPKLHSKCIEYLMKCSAEKKAIHGLEILEKDLLAKLFIETFAQIL